MNDKLSKEETKFIWLLSLILIIIACAPYLYGYLIRGDLFYGGQHIFNPGDGYVYLSYIEQVKEGKFLLDNLYTNEVENVPLFNPFWLIIGLVARIFNLSSVLALHLFRVILIPIFLWSLYKLISYFLPNYSLKRKKICFLYSIFASGLGGLLALFVAKGNLFYYFSHYLYASMDIWVPEAFNFLIILNSPHFIASLTLIILIFYYFLRSIEYKKLKYSLISGVLALFLFSFHPFYVPTIYLIPLFYLLFLFIKNKKIEQRSILSYFLLVFISLPSVLYYLFLLSTNLPLQIKASQNNCLTPGGITFFITYGLNLFFAIFAIVVLVQSKKVSDKSLFLSVWFWSSILLIYAPFNFQRRLTEGFQIPLMILSFMGLVAIFNFLKIKFDSLKKLIIIISVLLIFILFFCLTNLAIYIKDFKFLRSKPDIIYFKKEFIEALDWYKNQTTLKETLLSGWLDGNPIPGLIGRRIFIGHGIETVNFSDKAAEVKWFFNANNNDLDKKEFLRSNKINYVLYSFREKALGSFEPEIKDYLELVFKNSEVSIFKVIAD
jgi:hypothetical protein